MDELLIGLIRWSKVAALAAALTTIIVLVAHWHGLREASGSGNTPVTNTETELVPPVSNSNYAPAKNANDNCGCETSKPAEPLALPQVQAPPAEVAENAQPGEAAAPVIGTPAVNMQWAAPAPPAPPVGYSRAFASPPTPPVGYSGPEWQYSVTVRAKNPHRWPRRMIGGIGRGIGKVFGFGRRH
jgi:hypothetical protein